MPVIQYQLLRYTSHRGQIQPAENIRRAQPGCTLGLKRKHLVTWKGVNRECPDPSTFCSPLQHGTNSCTTGLIPEIHTGIHKLHSCVHSLRDCADYFPGIRKWRAESEVFTKSPPGLTQLPERGSRWMKLLPHISLSGRGKLPTVCLQHRSSLSVILRVGCSSARPGAPRLETFLHRLPGSLSLVLILGQWQQLAWGQLYLGGVCQEDRASNTLMIILKKGKKIQTFKIM